ncbi:MAG: selenocysteine-specific translation elongation factor [Chthonomonas sp.]|nr:selenocysteine-specific translation elongation factor [Chthonomonas sp.]
MAGIIGTAGHVDHGKSALIKALTSIDPDRLPEEKARGMTIDLGFAFLNDAHGARVSMVDVPGHESLITNMLAGAMGVQVCLLCVAADDGIMAQTREHFALMELLPVERMVVAITKADLADAELLRQRRKEVQSLFSGTRFASSPIVTCSVVDGHGLEDVRRQLLSAHASLGEPRRGGAALWVDRAFAQKGRGNVVTGSLLRGELRVGEDLVAWPRNWRVKILELQVHGQTVASVEGPERVAILLSSKVTLEEMPRGTLLAEPQLGSAETELHAQVRWVSDEKPPRRVRVGLGTEDVLADLRMQGETAILKLDRPVGVIPGSPIILRRHSPMDLLGGGMLVPATATGNTVLSLIERAANGVTTEVICRKLGRTPQELGDEFERLKRAGTIVGLAGTWLAADHLQTLARACLSAMETFHTAHPALPGPKSEQVEIALTGKPRERLLALLAQQGHLRAQGNCWALTSFRMRLNERQGQLVERLVQGLAGHGFNPPNPYELGKELNIPLPTIEEGLRLGQTVGAIVQVAADVYLGQATVVASAQALREKFGTNGFCVGEARTVLNTSRRVAVPLLETLDRLGHTQRDGDQRRFL